MLFGEACKKGWRGGRKKCRAHALIGLRAAGVPLGKITIASGLAPSRNAGRRGALALVGIAQIAGPCDTQSGKY